VHLSGKLYEEYKRQGNADMDTLGSLSPSRPQWLRFTRAARTTRKRIPNSIWRRACKPGQEDKEL